VTRLVLDFVVALADAPRPPRPFRAQCRAESAATRRGLEMPAAEVVTSGPRPRWGIGTRGDSCESEAPIVVRVTANSPMARAGVLLGDRIVAIDGMPLADQPDMLAKLSAAGHHIEIDVDRKGRRLRLGVTAEPPASGTGP